MKVFNLSCDIDHAFEGWFASLEEFERQSEDTLLRCPICDSAVVRRLPTAPRLHLGSSAEQAQSAVLPTKKLLNQISELMAASEDVGDRFAEEARRIHYLETKARNIRGIATPQERAELHEEGIETLSLPMPMALKDTLQ